MSVLRTLFVVLLAGLGLALTPALPVAGSGEVCAAEAPMVGGLALPNPQKGKGDQCVAPTDYMRRNHMNELLHQRDNTVHNGVRTRKFSLVGCINCHAVNGDDGQPVSVESPKHFCRECHDFAAVRIDCFECHNSKPDGTDAAVLGTPHRSSRRLAAMTGFNWGQARRGLGQ